MPKNNDFNDRLETAAKAKKALLERARANAPANSPAFAARQEERVKVSEAREQRLKEKAALKVVEEQRKADEKEAAALAALQAKEAVATAAEAERNQKAADAIALKAKQKAGRDAKYAARQERRNTRASSSGKR
jgi:hypothetical protein